MFERWEDSQAVEWAKKVKVRDNHVCQLCHRYGIPLNSHHLNSWDLFVEQRYELDNGVTLCVRCHERFHSIYGRGKNTLFQFQQFKKSISLFKQANEKLIK
jgi:5-methylcytosine-specific restriction endonuclease McrA